jgi:hypothetical protein
MRPQHKLGAQRVDVLPLEIDRKAAKGLATTLIMRRIAALLDPRHRGAYGGDS